jgi:hypothetical protein
MSALPPKADIAKRDHHVRFVPKADVRPPAVAGWIEKINRLAAIVAGDLRSASAQVGLVDQS